MFVKETKSVVLDESLLSFVAQWKDKPGNLIMILHRVQEVYGFIPKDVALEISVLTGVPLAKIYGVITFYNFFKLKKPGKYKIQVCMGTACYLKGGFDLVEELKNTLGISVDETTDDELFSIESVRCIGCCGLSPVLVINNSDVHGKLVKEDIARIITKYKSKA
jgi:NADH-quinone oxidoreductase subunit E